MNTVVSNNTLVTNPVTTKFKNTHCIICGNPFQTGRFGKLYCSAKCKQYGFNHKEEINNVLANTINGINRNLKSFYIDEFSQFDERVKMIKKYKELKRKENQWNSTDREIKLRQNIGLDVNEYMWNNLIRSQLTDNDEIEIYKIEDEIIEEILCLNLRELTLEQWSFLKSLHSDIDEISFYRTVSSLGSEFINELNLQPVNPKESNEHLIIKNRFINHCNLIAEGKIKFIQKSKVNEKSNQD